MEFVVIVLVLDLFIHLFIYLFSLFSVWYVLLFSFFEEFQTGEYHKRQNLGNLLRLFILESPNSVECPQTLV